MRTDCFAYVGEKKEDSGIRWTDEKCFCLTTRDCDGCSFYKHKDTVSKHTFFIYQTKIVEWIPK